MRQRRSKLTRYARLSEGLDLARELGIRDPQAGCGSRGESPRGRCGQTVTDCSAEMCGESSKSGQEGRALSAHDGM